MQKLNEKSNSGYIVPTVHSLTVTCTVFLAGTAWLTTKHHKIFLMSQVSLHTDNE